MDDLPLLEKVMRDIVRLRKELPSFDITFGIKIKDDKQTDLQPDTKVPSADTSEPYTNTKLADDQQTDYQGIPTIMSKWWKLHKDDPEIDCDICGKPYKRMDAKQKYCSHECYRKAINISRLKKDTYSNCKNCNKEFLQSRSDKLYCSDRCSDEAERRRKNIPKLGHITYKCKRCGKGYRKSHPVQLYCSEQCFNEQRQETARDRRKPRNKKHITPEADQAVKKMAHACPQCGRRTAKVFCSDNCRKEHEKLAAETAHLLTDERDITRPTPPLERPPEKTTKYKRVVLPPASENTTLPTVPNKPYRDEFGQKNNKIMEKYNHS